MMKLVHTERMRLVPPDLERCQAEKPNGYTFMTLGGSPGLVRCTEKPLFIATEKEPGDDGETGSMSLCAHCLAVFLKQMPDGYAEIEGIKEGDTCRRGPKGHAGQSAADEGAC